MNLDGARLGGKQAFTRILSDIKTLPFAKLDAIFGTVCDGPALAELIATEGQNHHRP